MAYLLEKLRDLFLSEKTVDTVSGYTLMKNNQNNKTLIMERTNDASWRTKWVDHTSVKISEPQEKITSVFYCNSTQHSYRATAESIKDLDTNKDQNKSTQIYKDV